MNNLLNHPLPTSRLLVAIFEVVDLRELTLYVSLDTLNHIYKILKILSPL